MSSLKNKLLKHYKKNKQIYDIIDKMDENNLVKTSFSDIKNKIDSLLENDSPRYLTNEEIDDIVNNLPELPCIINKIRDFNVKQIRSKIKDQLQTFKVCPGGIEELKNNIYKQYIKASIPAGESVGLLSAMAIGQLFTQMNLNTFHSAGTKSVNVISSIKELFHVSKTKKIYSTTVHYKNKNLNYNEINELTKQTIEEVNMTKLIKKSEIIESLKDNDKWWYDNYLLTSDIDYDKIKDRRFLRITLDKVKMLTYNITISDIIENLEDMGQYLIVSPIHISIIDIYVNNNSTSNFKELSYTSDFETVFLSSLVNKCLDEIIIRGVNNLTDYSIESVDLLKYINSHKIEQNRHRIHINYFSIKLDGLTPEKYISFIEDYNFVIEEINFKNRPYYIDVSYDKADIDLGEDYMSVREYNKLLKSLSEDIKRMYRLPDKVTNDTYKKLHDLLNQISMNQKDPIKIIGSSISTYKKELQELIEKLNELNDTKTDIDSINEVKNTIKDILESNIYRNSKYYYVTAYGKKIMHQLFDYDIIDTNYLLPNDVIEINEYFGIESARLYLVREYVRLISKSAFINSANIELLVDFQTSLGFLSQVTSAGVNKQRGSLLSMASFEDPMSVFKQGASMGKKDDINGISGCIMSGKKCLNGTGITRVKMPENSNINPRDLIIEQNDGVVKVERVDVVDGKSKPTIDTSQMITLDDINDKLKKLNELDNYTLPDKKLLSINSENDIKPNIISELDLNSVNDSSYKYDNIESNKSSIINPPYFNYLKRFNSIY